jgi:hypothetical protein
MWKMVDYDATDISRAYAGGQDRRTVRRLQT